MKLIGIDDAGRGPVLGPMILAGVLIEDSEEKTLKELGAKDSKLLTPAKRRLLGDKIRAGYTNHIEITQPLEIDNSSNLNYLEAIKTAMIVNKLTESLNEEVKVIIDCPSTNIEAWQNDVQKLIDKPEIIRLVCEHKADYNHLVVSAASILAKEKREELMYQLRLKHKIDFGSGYPADPKTKTFIKDNFDKPEYKSLIRFCWKTVQKLIDEKAVNQQKLF